MSKDQEIAVTVTEVFDGAPVTDLDIAKLYKSLGVLNLSIENLSRASILNKGAAADHTLNAARDLLANQNFTIHKLFNEQTRIKAGLDRINKVMGFVDGE